MRTPLGIILALLCVVALEGTLVLETKLETHVGIIGGASIVEYRECSLVGKASADIP